MRGALSAAAIAVVLACTATAQAQPEPGSTEEARALFEAGLELAQQERWAEALERFRRSRAIVERPSTVFNIASVLTRLGSAREALVALDEFMRISDAEADADYRSQVPALRETIEQTLYSLVLSVTPAGARIEVDGELEVGEGGERVITLDPGRHGVSVEADGHRPERFDVTGEAGTRVERVVELEALPARLLVSSIPGASIRVDGEVVGVGEANIELRAGEHSVQVRAEDHEPFDDTVELSPGERFTLDAALEPFPQTSVFESWVFWSIVGAVVVGGSVTTIALLSGTDDPYGGTAGFTLQP